MNGTTRCPHCETRFKITDAQLAAHQGMVRCGHCLQSFDSRPNFIPDQPLPQLDQLIDEIVIEETQVAAALGEVPKNFEVAASVASALPADQPEYYVEVPVSSDELTAEESADPSSPQATHHLPSQAESEDALDFSQMAATQPVAEPVGESMPDETAHFIDYTPKTLVENVEQDVVRDELPVAPRRRTWLWVIGVFVLAVLLVAQSAYFFRVSLAAHLPSLKPALAGYCRLLRCTVSLPQQSELISIESSGLEAAPDHENEITFSALLRNRASYTQAFPVLALTLNDDQDKPLARRLFMPVDYLPADESLQTGFATNHEVSIKLRLNTADLRPVGYRLELFYRPD
ncbi:MAG: DUF3426 domain-containing protein [Gallionella sp.]|jgi:predicted Zn finger-like uncharacterized protein